MNNLTKAGITALINREIYIHHEEGNSEFVVYNNGFGWVVLSPKIELYGKPCKYVIGKQDDTPDGFNKSIELAKQLNKTIKKLEG